MTLHTRFLTGPGVRARGAAQSQKRRWSPANRTAPMSRAGVRSGCAIAIGSIR